jgi:hypothetical protein
MGGTRTLSRIVASSFSPPLQGGEQEVRTRFDPLPIQINAINTRIPLASTTR